MYTPNPILIGQTPSAGLTLTVTAGRGGMAGYVLLSQSGPPLTVEVSSGGGWSVPDLPYTLAAGETLRLTRADPSPMLTTLYGVALGDGTDPAFAPFVVTTDSEGYQTLSSGDATTGPFPMRGMHEALKTRVGALESAGPAGPGGAAPGFLSDGVLLDTTGTRPIDPAEIPDGLSVRSCQLILASPLTFSGLRGGYAQGYAGLEVYASSSQQNFSQGNYDLYNGGTGEGNVLLLAEPLTIPTGGVLQVGYGQWLSHADLTFRADPLLPPGTTYSVQARDGGGVPVSVPLVGLPFTLLTPRTVFGALAPDAMNVVDVPGDLTPGDFELVSPPGGVPLLRFKRGDGQVFTLPMTPE